MEECKERIQPQLTLSQCQLLDRMEAQGQFVKEAKTLGPREGILVGEGGGSENVGKASTPEDQWEPWVWISGEPVKHLSRTQKNKP